MTIVVTGATGHLGRLIVEALLRDGAAPSSLVAAGRNTDTLADLAERGVSVARLDYTDPASLAAAFAGADTLMLVSSSEVGQRATQHAAAIDAAKSAGITRIVYTSAPGATTSSLILAPEHKATEEYLHAAGVTYTILRNNWYTENYVGTARQAEATATILDSAGDGLVASATRADYADAAAAVLLGTGHDNATYELSGDHAWNFDELAAAIATVIGREVTRTSLNSADHAAALTAAGLDAGTVGFIVGLDANIADGTLSQTSGDLARIIDRPTTPLVDGLRAALA